MIIYGGSTGQVLAAQVANKLGAKLGKLEITKFPDGEKYIRYHDKVENEDVVLIHPMGLTPDELFIEYLLICSALKDGKAKSIVTFVPYFAYARQDSRFNPGEPGSFHLVSKIIDDLGIDMIYTIDLHLQRVNDLSELSFVIISIILFLTLLLPLLSFTSERMNLSHPNLSKSFSLFLFLL